MDVQKIFAHEDFKYTLIAVAIFLAFLIVRKLFIKYIYQLILKASRRSPSKAITQFLLAFERPLQWLFVIVGLYIAVDYFPYLSQSNLLFSRIIQSSVVVIITWGLFNFVGSTPLFFTRLSKHTDVKVDEIVIPFITKGLRLVIFAIAISIIAQIFTYPIGGFIAGLGLGGLAFALAAQDALANLFGGFVIITERPFTIGEWIKTPSVEGTVEDITFRSTKIRTFAQAVVTVPNSTLANEPITNWSEMGKRRVSSTVIVSYETPIESVKRSLEKINEYLRNNVDIHQETIFVAFDEFHKNGIEIMLYFFTKTTVWGEYVKVKEEVNFKVMDILLAENISIAIPSRRLYRDDENGNPNKETR